jgi:PBSX family phage portal protein
MDGVKQGRAFVLDSATGSLAKINSPLLAAGMCGPAEYIEIAKAVGEASTSQALREKYGTTIDGVQCASRPFDFHLFAYATSLNTYHARAIRAKVKDITGRGWQIKGDENTPLRRRIESFFKSAFGEMTFEDGMGCVWMDYEALGNGFLEVIQNGKNEPAQLAHVPGPEVWLRLDGLGFVQQKNGECAHFRRYGVADEKYAALPTTDPLNVAATRTSITHFSRYFPWSPYYGVPPIMPAWNRLVLMVLEAEYNIQFFTNNAIPDYVVFLEGEWGDDAERVITEYFRRHIQGQAHKTLVLSLPNGGKATFQKLTSDNAKEGSFRLLRTDCRDEILHAHGVPPQKVGIVETGKLGGNLSSEQNIEYKNSIVVPGQRALATRLNRIIELGFQAPDCTFEFTEYDIEDQKVNCEIDCAYLDRGVRVPNEVRAERYPGTAPLDGGDRPLTEQMAGAAAAENALTDIQRIARGMEQK